jgi:hypothetical protein
MVDYIAIAATAKRLVEANGRAVTLTGLKGVAANAAQPWDGPTDLVGAPLPLFGVFVPPNTVRQFGLTALGQGTEWIDLMTISEQMMITFPGEVDIRNYTTLNDGTNWGIIGSQVLKPADVTLLAFIGVKR